MRQLLLRMEHRTSRGQLDLYLLGYAWLCWLFSVIVCHVCGSPPMIEYLLRQDYMFMSFSHLAASLSFLSWSNFGTFARFRDLASLGQGYPGCQYTLQLLHLQFHELRRSSLALLLSTAHLHLVGIGD